MQKEREETWEHDHERDFFGENLQDVKESLSVRFETRFKDMAEQIIEMLRTVNYKSLCALPEEKRGELDTAISAFCFSLRDLWDSEEQRIITPVEKKRKMRELEEAELRRMKLQDRESLRIENNRKMDKRIQEYFTQQQRKRK